MKGAVVLAVIVAGCATTHQADMQSALANAVAAEERAWMHDGTRPEGVDPLVALTNIDARVDRVTFVSVDEAAVLATYKYTGRFADGHQGTLTLQRALRFSKSGTEWLPEAHGGGVEVPH